MFLKELKSFKNIPTGADNRSWTCMVLLPLEPESSASAYSAISANIKFIGQPRPRDSCGWRNFLRLGAPKKFRPIRLCLARCICHRQRSQANCLFRHTRILSFRPLNFTRRGHPRRSISLNPLDYYIINHGNVNTYFFVVRWFGEAFLLPDCSGDIP